jgi:hypothetical protein
MPLAFMSRFYEIAGNIMALVPVNSVSQHEDLHGEMRR